jgi:hypothetical protein
VHGSDRYSRSRSRTCDKRPAPGVVVVHLQECTRGRLFASPCKQRSDDRGGETAPARIGRRHHVVNGRETVVDRDLAACERAAVDECDDRVHRKRRMREPFEVCMALFGRRAAQRADGLDERRDRDVHELDARVASRRGTPHRADVGNLHERIVERDVASVPEDVVECRGLAERRDAIQRRQAARRIKPLASVDLPVDRQRGAEVRVHAACALRLPRGHPHEPAVVEKLALRLQCVEARFLDARRIEMHRRQLPSNRSPTASTSSV